MKNLFSKKEMEMDMILIMYIQQKGEGEVFSSGLLQSLKVIPLFPVVSQIYAGEGRSQG